MRRSLFTEDEVNQANERRLKYQGTARVKISEIEFASPTSQCLDDKNVERLCEIFRKNRCRRLDIDNFVPVAVSRIALADALQRSEVSARTLLLSSGRDIPFLTFSRGQLLGLHGRHRLCAASKILAPLERWWTVDLYLDGMNPIADFSRD